MKRQEVKEAKGVEDVKKAKEVVPGKAVLLPQEIVTPQPNQRKCRSHCLLGLNLQCKPSAAPFQRSVCAGADGAAHALQWGWCFASTVGYTPRKRTERRNCFLHEHSKVFNFTCT